VSAGHPSARPGVIVDVEASSSDRKVVVEFRAPTMLVAVELDPDVVHEPGQIAGVEGLGSELFFDAAGRLYALDLSPPLPGLSVRPVAELRAQVAGAQDGVLVARELAKTSLGGRRATFGTPFGAALFVFADDAPDDQLVTLGSGVVAAMNADGALSQIWVEGFDRRQRVFGEDVSIEHDGAEFIDALGALHLAYLGRAPADFAHAAQAIVSAVKDERLDRLANVYARMKAVDATVQAAHEDGT
jgi:hypothetical protein